MPARRRPVVALGALLLVFTVGACGGSTGGSDGDAAPATTAAKDSTASDPDGSTDTTLTFDEVTDAAATVTVTPDAGGTLEATGPDGTRYQLTVPPGAVTADLDVTVTPLADVKGGISRGPIVAARFAPDGQHFARLLTFTIRPATDIPAAEQFAFLADHDGSHVVPAPVDPRTGEATLLLQHFSIAGETGVNDSIFDDAFGTARGDLANEYQLRMEKLLQLSARSNGELRVWAELEELLDEFDAKVVKPAVDEIKSGPNRCSSVKNLDNTVLALARQRELMSMGNPSLDVLEVAMRAYTDCEREAIRACKRARKPDGLLQFWIGTMRQRALLGRDTEDDIPTLKEKAKKICVPVRYQASGGGPGMSITGTVPDLTRPFGLDGVGTGFSVQFSYTPSGDGRTGTLTYVGEGGGMTMSGRGTYTVTGEDPGPLTLTATTTGCVEGVGAQGCRENTDVITLTPLP